MEDHLHTFPAHTPARELKMTNGDPVAALGGRGETYVDPRTVSPPGPADAPPQPKPLPRLWDADAAGRKLLPLVSGCLLYFPDALAAVSHVSHVGNQQHNPGQPMHWAQEKSKDHLDCIGRHLAGMGTLDTDGIPHSWKLAWRALANLQMELQRQGAPVPPGAILPPR